MIDGRHIGDRYYPAFHPGWGGFAEELFHYTSRYYTATEAFLRNLVGDRAFSMSGYKAQDLGIDQRDVLAAILAAIMSTADSQLLVAASAIAHDLGLGRGHPGKKRVLKDGLGGKGKIDVQRFKGLGEMDAKDLKETTMDPATRTLIRVTIDEDEPGETGDLVERLMGKKPELRFQYIQENARFVEELDV